MATYQEIRHQIEGLTAEEQLQLLEELASIVRQGLISSSPLKQVDDSTVLAIESDWAGMSALEAAQRVIGGLVGDGPADLSTNPIYMEGFGE